MPIKKDFFSDNFEAALTKLNEFALQQDGSEIRRAGLIQAFEWAMAAGWFPTSEEPAWLSMLSDRNLTSHTYREKMAHDIAENVLKLHIPTMNGLFARIKSMGLRQPS